MNETDFGTWIGHHGRIFPQWAGYWSDLDRETRRAQFTQFCTTGTLADWQEATTRYALDPPGRHGFRHEDALPALARIVAKIRADSGDVLRDRGCKLCDRGWVPVFTAETDQGERQARGGRPVHPSSVTSVLCRCTAGGRIRADTGNRRRYEDFESQVHVLVSEQPWRAKGLTKAAWEAEQERIATAAARATTHTGIVEALSEDARAMTPNEVRDRQRFLREQVEQLRAEIEGAEPVGAVAIDEWDGSI